MASRTLAMELSHNYQDGETCQCPHAAGALAQPAHMHMTRPTNVFTSQVECRGVVGA